MDLRWQRILSSIPAVAHLGFRANVFNFYNDKARRISYSYEKKHPG